MLEFLVGLGIMIAVLAVFILVCAIGTNLWNRFIEARGLQRNKASVGMVMIGTLCVTLLGAYLSLCAYALGESVLR